MVTHLGQQVGLRVFATHGSDREATPGVEAGTSTGPENAALLGLFQLDAQPAEPLAGVLIQEFAGIFVHLVVDHAGHGQRGGRVHPQ